MLEDETSGDGYKCEVAGVVSSHHLIEFSSQSLVFTLSLGPLDVIFTSHDVNLTLP